MQYATKKKKKIVIITFFNIIINNPITNVNNNLNILMNKNLLSLY